MTTLAFDPVARAEVAQIHDMAWRTLPPRIAGYAFGPGPAWLASFAKRDEAPATRRVHLRAMISRQISRLRGASPIAEGSYWMSLDGQRCGWTTYSVDAPILSWPWVLILPEFQGKGVLGRVIDHLVEVARQTGCNAIQGAVDTQNHHSIHALRKRGFELGRTPKHYFVIARRSPPAARALRSLPLHAAATALASFGGDLPLPGGPRRATFLADGFVSLSLDGVGDVREADEIVGAVFANTLAMKVRATCTAEEPPIPTGAELEGIVHRVVKAVS